LPRNDSVSEQRCSRTCSDHAGGSAMGI
jgi:hypothetical protein